MSNPDPPASSPVSTWREKSPHWAGVFVTALITFVLVRIAVLNVFFNTGSLHDPPWLASITWHNRWRLPGPPAFPERYFSEHLSPVLWLTNAVSYAVPLDRFDYYAACVALSHAIYAAGVCRAWQLTETRTTMPRTLIAVVVALAAAFSGVAVIALDLPHPELAIPALALWFCIAVTRRAYRWAAFWLAACLLSREDAGLHVFALLSLWVIVLAARERRATPEIKWLLGFAAAFVAKRVYYPSGDILSRSYLGDPPFAHLTAAFVMERLRYYLLERTYVTLPLLLSLVWAWSERNPLLPLGFIACLPWLLLSIVAVNFTSGTMGYYYGFPFWLALAWPLLALRAWPSAGGRAYRRWPYALLLLTSLIGWHWDRIVIYPLAKNNFGESPFVYHDTLRNRARALDFTEYFLANQQRFGAVALDQAVFGLLIAHAGRMTWLEFWPAANPPDTMIYFIGAYEFFPRVLPLLRTGVYRCVYAVPETRIRIASQNPLTGRLPAPMPLVTVSSSLDTRC